MPEGTVSRIYGGLVYLHTSILWVVFSLERMLFIHRRMYSHVFNACMLNTCVYVQHTFVCPTQEGGVRQP